jgi:hypothetical protein
MIFHCQRFVLVSFFSLPLLAGSVSYAAVSFAKEIWPFLEKRCVECHKAPFTENGKKKEPKAGLRLDGAWAMMKGSEDGPVIKPKEADKSALYSVVTLPKDDDDHMPPKGEPLSESEIKLLKRWIDEGADFGTWEGNTEGKPAQLGAEGSAARKRKHDDFYKALEAGAKPVADAVLKKVTDAGAQVATISTTSALVRVDFLTGVSKCDDAKVATLLLTADNVAHLDLGRTIITDAALATVAKMPRLARLDLRQTKITDKGLESLTALKKLQVLNLFGTEVTDMGVQALASLKSLKQVFLWQSKATEAGAKKLQAALPSATFCVK